MSDALLYAFTKPATQIVAKDVPVNVAMNWYFIAASVVVLLPAVYWVTMRFVCRDKIPVHRYINRHIFRDDLGSWLCKSIK